MSWIKDFNNLLTKKMNKVHREVVQHERSIMIREGKEWRRGEPLSDVDKELAEFITEKDVTANIYR